jgi:hypothetical protein
MLKQVIAPLIVGVVLLWNSANVAQPTNTEATLPPIASDQFVSPDQQLYATFQPQQLNYNNLNVYEADVTKNIFYYTVPSGNQDVCAKSSRGRKLLHSRRGRCQ